MYIHRHVLIVLCQNYAVLATFHHFGISVDVKMAVIKIIIYWYKNRSATDEIMVADFVFRFACV